MSDEHPPSSSPYGNRQIAIAALGVALCAACGLAWLGSGGGSEPSSSFAASQTTPNASQTASSSGKSVPAEGEETFTVQTAGPKAAAYAVIVRFEGEPILDEIGESFRKDPEAARQRFRDWVSGRPALAGLRLERASYSGELVLTGDGSRSMNETIAAIEAMDNVAYVEPDYSAKPSGEN